MTLREILNRWKAETPTFFKKIITLGGTLVALSTIILGSQFFTELPANIQTFSGYAFTVGSTLTVISKLAVKDPRDIL